MEITEEPLILTSRQAAIYGIHRYTSMCKDVVIMLPALTGTRIGPQNIYVEIARKLAGNNMACLCLELPPAGDSYDIEINFFDGTPNQRLFARYKYYLDLIIPAVRKQFSYANIYLCSISFGCLPVLYYCQENKLAGAILLSPNHLGESINHINKKNLKSYMLKAKQLSTWKKIFSLKVNYKKVIGNILLLRQPNKGKAPESPNQYNTRILCVFGEKDAAINDMRLFWSNFCQKNDVKNYKEAIIDGADHSFFGWVFKADVCNAISDWLMQS